MSIVVYDKGDSVHITAVFEDENNVAVDPTLVTLKVMDPSGNIDSYTLALANLTKDSTGNYSADVDADEVGEWRYEWVSTGDAQGVEPGQFVVQPTVF